MTLRLRKHNSLKWKPPDNLIIEFDCNGTRKTRMEMGIQWVDHCSRHSIDRLLCSSNVYIWRNQGQMQCWQERESDKHRAGCIWETFISFFKNTKRMIHTAQAVLADHVTPFQEQVGIQLLVNNKIQPITEEDYPEILYKRNHKASYEWDLIMK